MPKNNRLSWLNKLQSRINIPLFNLVIAALLLWAVSMLIIICVVHPPKSLKNNTSNEPTAIFVKCTCDTNSRASLMSPNLFKLPLYMLQPSHRLVIYAGDIRRLTGCSRSTSIRQIAALKQKLKKQSYQYITIEEYCIDKGLNYEKTLQQLKLK